jgi:hypothetical protein
MHGGAPGPALDVVFEIGDATGAPEILRRKLEAGEKLMDSATALQGPRPAREGARGRAERSAECVDGLLTRSNKGARIESSVPIRNTPARDRKWAPAAHRHSTTDQ